MFISVVIPAYNEAKCIVDTLDKVKNFLKNNFDNFEIIVVDDKSTDATLSILKQQSGLRLIRNLKNHGKGYTVAKGIKFSKGEWVLFMDADSSTDVSELKKFLPYLGANDLVIGSRGLANSEIKIKQKFYKVLLGKIGNRLIRFLIAPGISDTQCGFKMINQKYKFLFDKLTIATFGFDFELLWLAHKYDLRVKEVPVVWANDFDSKVKWYDYPKTLLQVFKVRINDKLGKYN